MTLHQTVRTGRNCWLGDNVRVGENTRIGNNVTIEGEVEIGADCFIGHGVVITGPVRLAAGNILHPYVVIGQEPQHPDQPNSRGGIKIGKGNTFREFTTVHLPTSGCTLIGDDNYMMAYCHVAHDCIVGSHVKMANAATLAGGCTVHDRAYIGLHAVIHQGLEIGALSMIGMNSEVLKHVPPFATMIRGAFSKVNTRGMMKAGYSTDRINRVLASYGFTTPMERDPDILSFLDRVKSDRVYLPATFNLGN